jgi:hypothetical protein
VGHRGWKNLWLLKQIEPWGMASRRVDVVPGTHSVQELHVTCDVGRCI